MKWITSAAVLTGLLVAGCGSTGASNTGSGSCDQFDREAALSSLKLSQGFLGVGSDMVVDSRKFAREVDEERVCIGADRARRLLEQAADDVYGYCARCADILDEEARRVD